jgi:diguanylate cyclase (GGDEF)-like protein
MEQPFMPLRWNRKRQDAEQASADADQTAAEADQTASDTDQSASDRDQAQADVDQRASDRDQAASNRDLADQDDGDDDGQQVHARSRADRAEGTLDRNAGAVVRAQVSSERDDQAKERDNVALARDLVAQQRDRVAEQDDRNSERLAEDLGSPDPGAARAVEALAETRAKAAAARVQAAADRKRAARDRAAAAEDREHLLAELERAHLDELTGAYRRRMGEVALLQEIENAKDSKGDLAFAYIDFDGLKDMNDREGHAAGDALLTELVALLRSELAPFDPVVRWGGDEFVCTFSNTDLETARSRFEKVRAALDENNPGARITVGFAVLKEDDSLETVMERADADLLEARSKRS